MYLVFKYKKVFSAQLCNVIDQNIYISAVKVRKRLVCYERLQT